MKKNLSLAFIKKNQKPKLTLLKIYLNKDIETFTKFVLNLHESEKKLIVFSKEDISLEFIKDQDDIVKANIIWLDDNELIKQLKTILEIDKHLISTKELKDIISLQINDDLNILFNLDKIDTTQPEFCLYTYLLEIKFKSLLSLEKLNEFNFSERPTNQDLQHVIQKKLLYNHLQDFIHIPCRDITKKSKDILTILDPLKQMLESFNQDDEIKNELNLNYDSFLEKIAEFLDTYDSTSQTELQKQIVNTYQIDSIINKEKISQILNFLSTKTKSTSTPFTIELTIDEFFTKCKTLCDGIKLPYLEELQKRITDDLRIENILDFLEPLPLRDIFSKLTLIQEEDPIYKEMSTPENFKVFLPTKTKLLLDKIISILFKQSLQTLVKLRKHIFLEHDMKIIEITHPQPFQHTNSYNTENNKDLNNYSNFCSFESDSSILHKTKQNEIKLGPHSAEAIHNEQTPQLNTMPKENKIINELIKILISSTISLQPDNLINLLRLCPNDENIDINLEEININLKYTKFSEIDLTDILETLFKQAGFESEHFTDLYEISKERNSTMLHLNSKFIRKHSDEIGIKLEKKINVEKEIIKNSAERGGGFQMYNRMSNESQLSDIPLEDIDSDHNIEKLCENFFKENSIKQNLLNTHFERFKKYILNTMYIECTFEVENIVDHLPNIADDFYKAAPSLDPKPTYNHFYMDILIKLHDDHDKKRSNSHYTELFKKLSITELKLLSNTISKQKKTNQSDENLISQIKQQKDFIDQIVCIFKLDSPITFSQSEKININFLEIPNKQHSRNLEENSTDLEENSRNLEENSTDLEENSRNLEENSRNLEENSRNLEEIKKNILLPLISEHTNRNIFKFIFKLFLIKMLHLYKKNNQSLELFFLKTYELIETLKKDEIKKDILQIKYEIQSILSTKNSDINELNELLNPSNTITNRNLIELNTNLFDVYKLIHLKTCIDELNFANEEEISVIFKKVSNLDSSYLRHFFIIFATKFIYHLEKDSIINRINKLKLLIPENIFSDKITNIEKQVTLFDLKISEQSMINELNTYIQTFCDTPVIISGTPLKTLFLLIDIRNHLKDITSVDITNSESDKKINYDSPEKKTIYKATDNIKRFSIISACTEQKEKLIINNHSKTESHIEEAINERFFQNKLDISLCKNIFEKIAILQSPTKKQSSNDAAEELKLLKKTITVNSIKTILNYAKYYKIDIFWTLLFLSPKLKLYLGHSESPKIFLSDITENTNEVKELHGKYIDHNLIKITHPSSSSKTMGKKANDKKEPTLYTLAKNTVHHLCNN